MSSSDDVELDVLGDEAHDRLLGKDARDAEAPPAKTPLPWVQVGLICSLMLAENLSKMVLFPFVPFYVIHVGVADTPEEVGYYSGLLASAALFGQLLSSTWWGGKADEVGRRPVILFGLCASMTALVSFGMSTTFPAALAIRFLGGLFNGNLGVMKTQLGEVCDSTNSAQAFAILSTLWYVGGVVSPIVGGTFAEPYGKGLPVVSSMELFRVHPYLLPCLISAGFILVVFVLCVLYLRETLDVASAADDKAPAAAAAGGAPTSKSSVLHIPSARYACLMYGVVAFIDILFRELFPLWAILPRSSGGLDFGSEEIGLSQSISIVLLLVYLFTLFPRVIDALGNERCFRSGVCLCLPAVFLPVCAYLDTIPSWTLLELQLLLNAIGLENAYVCIQVIINESVGPQLRGSANGLATSLAAGLRFVGPVVGGCFWSYLSQHPFPGYQFVAYGGISLAAAGAVAMSFRVGNPEGR